MPELRCDACGKPTIGFAPVVYAYAYSTQGELAVGYEPSLEDIRTSAIERFYHPACYALLHGDEALARLIRERGD